MGWIVAIGVGAAVGVGGGVLCLKNPEPGLKAYIWTARIAWFVYFVLLTWDGFSGDKKAQIILPWLFGTIVVTGIGMVIQQLEDLKRYLVDHQPRHERDKDAEEFYGQVKRLMETNRTKAPADHAS